VPTALTSQSNLALVLGDLGRLEEAEAEHRAVLEIRARVLGAEYPDTLTSRSHLAAVLGNLGQLEQAEAESPGPVKLRVAVNAHDARYAPRSASTATSSLVTTMLRCPSNK
jgi:hypothetical protein